jgi:hypothetical protein
MIKVNVEIRLANDLHGASEVEIISKDDVLRDKAVEVQELLTKQIPHLALEHLMISQGESWKKLPKKLYRVTEPDTGDTSVFMKSRKKIGMPYSEYATFHMHAGRDADIPEVEVNLSNIDIMA